MKTETDAKDFTGLTQWNDYLNFNGLNLENAKESQIIQNLEILLKKIEVVNIAQGNLSNYIDNLDYAINLYENKRSSLIGRYLIYLYGFLENFMIFLIFSHSGNAAEEGVELKQLQYKINSLQESIKLIENNLLKELKIFQEKLYFFYFK